jgi:hypothetical protein
MAAAPHITIRPFQHDDIVLMRQRPLWGTPHVMIPPEDKGLAATTADGTLVGYCGFSGSSRSAEARISAVQSRMPGAGSALLDALKARFYLLVAVDVLETAAPWWERRGFVLMYPATEDDEAGVIGSFRVVA